MTPFAFPTRFQWRLGNGAEAKRGQIEAALAEANNSQEKVADGIVAA